MNKAEEILRRYKSGASSREDLDTTQAKRMRSSMIRELREQTEAPSHIRRLAHRKFTLHAQEEIQKNRLAQPLRKLLELIEDEEGLSLELKDREQKKIYGFVYFRDREIRLTAVAHDLRIRYRIVSDDGDTTESVAENPVEMFNNLQMVIRKNVLA